MAHATVNGSLNHKVCATGDESKPAVVAATAISLLDQCSVFIGAVGGHAYAADSQVLKGGTIGKHIRHTLDHFRAVLDGAQRDEIVDYDNRERNVPMETDPGAALEAVRELRQRLLGITEGDIGARLRVRVMLTGDGARAELASTLGRELAFATHHAVHHHAMLSAIAAEFGINAGPEFGKAPSTICHERDSC